jgi:hypothetical protein
MRKVNRLVVVGAALVIGTGVTTGVGTPAVAADPAGSPGTAGFVPSQEAVPGIAPPDADGSAVYLDAAGRLISQATGPNGGSDPTLIGCTPESGRDNPHYSGGDVSGHGWWKKGSCSNNRAKVYNCLYEWYTDNSWRQKACSLTRELRPYTGSGDRTVARHVCGDTNVTSWRNHVDVDVIGEIDSGEWPYNQANVACRVY